MAPRPVPRSRRLTGRGRVALRAVATVSFVAGLFGGFVVARADEDTTAVPIARPRASTALLSARRLPYVFVDAVARTRLQTSIAEFVAPYDACLSVDDADAGNGVLAATPDRPLIPASTLKLLTAAAALEALGPDHRFLTRIVGDDEELTLVGGGDPVLTTPEYEARLRDGPRTAADVVTRLADLADAIVATGIGAVAELSVDDSRHDSVRFLPVWRAEYDEDVGQLSAVTVDDGFEGTTRVDDPALLAGRQLAALLSARGVIVGAVARATAPLDAREVARVESPTVAEIVTSMLTSSDNLTAELLLREIGLARADAGTTDAGAQAAVAILDELGVPTEGLVLADGSGLARSNLATCGTLVAVLGLASDPRFAALDHGLSIAGRSGTLATRLQGDPLEAILRAKTGFLDDVAGLAGVLDDDEALHFAFVVNDDMSTETGRALQVDAARLVAGFPDAPAAADLVPAP
ncbi:MAG: D-alanyl-D-alanine carboxypeptidase/D-alanyl-D-alanine endopeptidase [Actinomycetota bacterium]